MHCFSTISRDQFQEIEDALKELIDFVDFDIKPQFDPQGKSEETASTALSVTLAKDIIYCYDGLGNGLDFTKPECISIVLLFTKVLKVGKDTCPTYDNFDVAYFAFLTMENKISSIYKTILTGNSILGFLPALKRRKNKDLLVKYVILLYRFTSIIAKLDGIATQAEIKWLNTIMSWKESDGEGINNDDAFNNSDTTNNKIPSIEKLDELIGLRSVKQEIHSLRNFLIIQQERLKKGMKSTQVSNHCVFLGNPGTGKTTVARIVAQIYKELGILKSGHLVETDRSGLVAEYVGQTAIKTNKIIDSALDGILFIDEAYSLIEGGISDFGKEAISTLIKRMEDDRNRLIVILAGYKDEMNRFLNSNPGLQSRFNRIIEFPDYSTDELYQIFEANCKKFDYSMSDASKVTLKELLNNSVLNKNKGFGNARFVRNLFEKTIENQANRLSKTENLTKETLSRIEAEDLKY